MLTTEVSFNSLIMTQSKKTMATISYGISKPKDLLEKLKQDANELNHPYNPYHIFNFMITAYSLSEWIEKHYKSFKNGADEFKVGGKDLNSWKLPDIADQWVDTHFLPTGTNYKFHIKDALSICNHSANASKHYLWQDSGSIKAISENPLVSDWYQYTYQSRALDLFVNIDDRTYSFNQIKNIVVQFYSGLIAHYDLQDSKN
ncbi:MAG TPA: hypothetical protein VGD04_01780 [Methylophilus sp.]